MMRYTFSVICKLLGNVIPVRSIISIVWSITFDFAADGRRVTLQTPADLSAEINHKQLKLIKP